MVPCFRSHLLEAVSQVVQIISVGPVELDSFAEPLDSLLPLLSVLDGARKRQGALRGFEPEHAKGTLPQSNVPAPPSRF